MSVNGSGNIMFFKSNNLSYICSAMFVHPRLAFIITDEKDLSGCVTGMFSGPMCRRPCSMCLLDFTQESLVQVGEVRTLQFMRQVNLILR